MTIAAAGSPLTITTTSLPNGTVGAAYNQTLSATGGKTPYSWSVTVGTLPGGLTLGSSTGTVSGTPNTAGTSNFTVQVKDSSTPAQTATHALSILINSANNPVPTIASLSPSSAPAGSANLQLTINGTNFVSGATVSFGGSNLQNPAINTQGTQISVTVPSSDLVTAGAVAVIVTNLSPGGGASNSATFTITQATTYSQTQIFATGNLTAVDDNGGILVVGNGGNGLSGGFATVFINAGSGWSQATQLNNPDGEVVSVAISGDGNTIVVGSCGNAVCKGHAFLYTVTNGAWPTAAMNPTAMLSASNAQPNGGDRIGFSVATDQVGDTVAVGAPCDYTAGILLCGTVYVYEKPGATWSSKAEDAQLTVNPVNPPIVPIPTVGFSVSMDGVGQTIIAGAPGVESSPNVPGAVYVFVKPGTNWNTWNAKSTPVALTESNGAGEDAVGFSVAISEDGHTVVAGAPFAHCSSNCNPPGPGLALVFLNPSSPSAWARATEQATLAATSGQNRDAFGWATTVSANGATIAIGAPGWGVAIAGTTYVFQVPGGGWSGPINETQALSAASGTAVGGASVSPQNALGLDVSISGDASTVAAGGRANISGGNTSQGVVYLFQ
jgi:hypothetical protein